MAFLNNIPQPGDRLKVSQGQLLGNNQQLDTSMGVDHYPFSNLTSDNGKHKYVTSIDQVTHPSTIANEPKFYGVSQISQLGVIQYSRGPSNAVPTPVTSIHSPGAVSAPATVFDFNGLTIATAMLYAFSGPTSGTYFIWWDGTTLTSNQLTSGASLSITTAGGQLIITTGGANIYWTLHFERLQ